MRVYVYAGIYEMYLYRDMQTHVDNLFGVSTISLLNGSKGYIHLILSVENTTGYIANTALG